VKSNLSRVIAVLFIAALAASCAMGTSDDGAEMVSYRTLLSRNVSNLNKLSLGMTKPQVVETMGNIAASTSNSVVPNPYKTEPFLVGKTQYEALYYMTRKYPPFTSIKLTQATPVVLREGKVIGWSVQTLQAARAGKYEK
jgi:hypothetical protein